MHYLVDTYNLVHAAATMGGILGDMSVRKLCRLISATGSSIRVTLVLDGRAKPDEPSENEFPDISLVYSGSGITADAVMAQMVEKAKNRRKWTIVSNDRAVVLHARRHFASAIGCESFLLRLTQNSPRSSDSALPPRKITGTPTTGESEHWMREFGLELPPDAPSPAPPTRGPGPTPSAKTGDPEIDDLDIEALLGPRES